jgi:hypothetical protein
MDLSKDIFAPFIAAVCAGVVLAALASGWLKLAPKGKKYWDTLGTFQGPATRSASFKVEGIRPLFVVAALGLIIAVAALSAALFASRPKEGPPGPPGAQGTFKGTLSFATVTFGQSGSSENGHDPGEPFPGTNPGVAKAFAPVAKFPICGFLELRTGTGGTCRLSQSAGQWEITATGNIACSTVCYQTVLPQ